MTGSPAEPLPRHLGGSWLHRQPLGQVRLWRRPHETFMVFASPAETMFSVALQRYRPSSSPNNMKASSSARQWLSQTCWTGLGPPTHPVSAG